MHRKGWLDTKKTQIDIWWCHKQKEELIYVLELLDLINTGSKNYLLEKVEIIKVRDALKLESWKEKENVMGNAEEFWNIGIQEIKDNGNIFMLVNIEHTLLQGHLCFVFFCFFFLLFTIFCLLINETVSVIMRANYLYFWNIV